MISEATKWIELIPAGRFSTNDGRGPFYNDDPAGVVARTRAAMRGGLVIDADHATDRAAPQGLPAPALGWIRDLRVVNGAIQGRVEWTVRGAAAFKAKEYRFVSPVFTFEPPAGEKDAMTGSVGQILRAALTNNPALSQLPAIAASRLPVVPLSAMEKKICADMGTSEIDYAAAKARRFASGGKVPAGEQMATSRTGARITMAQCLKEIERQAAEQRRRGTAQVELSADERKICAAYGHSEADYAAAKARRLAQSATIAVQGPYDSRPVLASRVDAAVARLLGPMSAAITDMTDRTIQAAPAAQMSELSEEDRKFCWLTGMSPSALMATRETHRQMVLTHRSETEMLRREFGPSRITVAELGTRGTR